MRILGQVEQLFRREDDLIGLNEHLTKLAKANNGRASIRKKLAKILMELGLTDEAIKAYEKIIELTPGSRENREAFTSLLIRADKTDRAVKQMEALIAQHSKDAELQIRLAELCHKLPAPKKPKRRSTNSSLCLVIRNTATYVRPDCSRNSKILTTPKPPTLRRSKSSKTPIPSKESWADFLFRSGEKDQAVKVWQALAKDTDRAGLARLARLVSVRKLNQVALDMLLARYDELKLDSIYLGTTLHRSDRA